MRRTIVFLFLVTLAFAQRPDGFWAGSLMLPGAPPLPVELRLAETLQGTLLTLPEGAPWPIEAFEQDGSRVRFSSPRNGGTLLFEGSLASGILSGMVTWAGQRGSLSVVRLLELPQSALLPFSGSYRFPSGEVVFIHGDRYVSFLTGESRTLYPVSPLSFITGTSLGLALPQELDLRFLHNDAEEVTGLERQRFGFEREEAVRLHYAREEVRFGLGALLAGTVVFPVASPPYRAVLILPGSGAVTRSDLSLSLLRDFLLLQGYAVLTYDKRGVGASGGFYPETILLDDAENTVASKRLELLAQDGLTALRFLRQHPAVDSARVGLVGISQGGHIAPRVAVGVPELPFLIGISAPAVDLAFLKHYSHLTGGGTRPPENSPLSRPPAGGFDPLPSLERLNLPALWLYGARDQHIPVPESVARLEGLEKDFRIVVLEGADHYLYRSRTGLEREVPFTSGYSEGYFRTLARFLESF